MSQLPSTHQIPQVLTNAKVYRDGIDLIGIATVELPSSEYMTETPTGLGIAGEIDSPVTGNFKAQNIKLTWNTPTEQSLQLLQPKAHQLELRGSIQEYDAGRGEFVHKAVKCLVRAAPKKSDIGKAEPGKKMDPETEMEVMYIKLFIDGKEIVELDKFNFIFRVDGSDLLSAIRQNLGI